MKTFFIFYLVFIFTLHVSETSCRAEQSSKEETIIDILSLAKESKTLEELIEGVHENENVLKAMSLFLQLPNTQDMDIEEMIRLFSSFCFKSGWKDSISISFDIKRVENTLYLVSIGAAVMTQPSSLYVFYDSSYKRIATGENGLIDVIDYRMVDDELGVIFNRVPGSTAFKPDFALLRKEKGKWNVKWTPEGQREWIAVKGEIKFLKADLSLIKVRGSSFALQSGLRPNKEEFFIERYFIGIWEKKRDSYVRRSKLPPDAPFYDKLWEMTDISSPLDAAHATIFEFLRRLRNAEDLKAAELSSVAVIERAKELGLSETTDQKGNLIHYEAREFTLHQDAVQLFFSRELYSFTEVLGFVHVATGAVYRVTLIPGDETSPGIRWRIVEIAQVYK